MGTIDINLVQCLVFSGLIVAVDPVAVSNQLISFFQPKLLPVGIQFFSLTFAPKTRPWTFVPPLSTDFIMFYCISSNT